jgi:AcrR family transcriptional regulator
MVIDRRVVRTRTALIDALVALIRCKAYDDITVDDVLREANVGRATFYSHFTSKDDLLAKSFDRLRALLVAAYQGSSGSPFPRDSSWSPSRTLFEHVAQFSDVRSALEAGRGGAILWAALDGAIAGFLRAALPARLGAAVPRELVVRDVVARVIAVFRWWFEHQPEMSAGEAHELLARLLSDRMPPEAYELFVLQNADPEMN